MIFRFRLAPAAALLVVLAAGRIGAADGPPQFRRPPTKVVAAHGEAGVLAPQGDFLGSVYFKDVSDVATEVRGKVLEVRFDDGDRVEEGQLLVRLDDELLRKDLAATQARNARDRTLLEDARLNLKRAEELVGRGLAPAEQLDSRRFDVQALESSVSETAAMSARLQTLVNKSSIHAPFAGIVIDRMTDVGEWMSEGSTVATIARENQYEVTVDVPEASVPFVSTGQEVELHIGGRSISGVVGSIIPRGDVATRTFPVKMRIQTEFSLMEGMTARARLPIAASVECLLLPRDAILNQLGSNYVFTVLDGVARKHPVEIVGYDGMTVGVSSDELGPGQLFLVKGHERLLDGDSVEIAPEISPVLPRSTAQ